MTTWDLPIEFGSIQDAAYRAQLVRAAALSGSDESVRTARIQVDGSAAAIVAWDFAFLGGSVGMAASTRLVRAVRRATREGLPLLVVTRSGGTRMQEGSPAFIQMVAIAGAVAAHRKAGLPVLVHVETPTTGGVLATIGSSGDVTTAAPGALVGFLGPRAVAAITGHGLSPGIQSAENLLRHGVLDAVLTLREARALWVELLRLWRARHSWRDRGPVGDPPATGATRPPADPDALWSAVRRTRQGSVSQKWVLDHVDRFVRIPGDAEGHVGAGALVGLGWLGRGPVAVLATCDDAEQPLGVGGLRTLRRGVALAARWGLPILTVVDTLGAELSAPAEEAGITGQIARLLTDLVSAEVPTVGLLLGAGTGGAALALLGTDRIVATGHAWVAPLAPEGAAAIQQGAAGPPSQVAWDQRIGAHALADLGFVHHVVDSDAPDWHEVAARAAADSVLRATASGPGERVARFGAWQ